MCIRQCAIADDPCSSNGTQSPDWSCGACRFKGVALVVDATVILGLAKCGLTVK